MVSIGDTAPNFSETDVITGNTFTLFPDHAGNVILLAFISYG
jgi:hypothetical protein